MVPSGPLRLVFQTVVCPYSEHLPGSTQHEAASSATRCQKLSVVAWITRTLEGAFFMASEAALLSKNKIILLPLGCYPEVITADTIANSPKPKIPFVSPKQSNNTFPAFPVSKTMNSPTRLEDNAITAVPPSVVLASE